MNAWRQSEGVLDRLLREARTEHPPVERWAQLAERMSHLGGATGGAGLSSVPGDSVAVIDAGPETEIGSSAAPASKALSLKPLSLIGALGLGVGAVVWTLVSEQISEPATRPLPARTTVASSPPPEAPAASDPIAPADFESPSAPAPTQSRRPPPPALDPAGAPAPSVTARVATAFAETSTSVEAATGGSKESALLWEIRQLRQVEAALRSNAPERALRLLDQLRITRLRDHARALRSIALCSSGHVEAGRRSAAALSRSAPRSGLEARVQKACGSTG